MTKYRIKEITDDTVCYILQKRAFLIFWKTLEVWDKFEFPIPYGCPRRFWSKEDAQRYLIRLLSRSENSIVAKLNKYGEEIVSK